MKALILAAGLGTRLLPLTKAKPKPLFPILGRPLLDILIRQLQEAGCTEIMVNTHHLAHLIDRFIQTKGYGIPVLTRHEPEILGTGGAIKNVEDFWGGEPFLVINGDILTSIDLAGVYRFHLDHESLVTMVLHDCDPFNHVWLDPEDRVRGFGLREPCPPEQGDFQPSNRTRFRKVAFTGIQVLDPAVLDRLPGQGFCNIIDVFCEMLGKGDTIQGLLARNHYWHDIGTIEAYERANRDLLARKAFGKAFPEFPCNCLGWSRLKGDGSDRRWYRVTALAGSRERGEQNSFDERAPQPGPSIILVDHGPPPGPRVCEADAFNAIGRHLRQRGVPVPRILACDRDSGLAAVEDLGAVHLQDLARSAKRTGDVIAHYKAVIDGLVYMGVEGARGFNVKWACQTPFYDRDLILEREARYFVEAFLNDYLGRGVDFHSLKDEFGTLAQKAVDHPYKGFLHRDFQSRNILIKEGGCFFIDFQGGRLGPLQYDLASLLIDPYVSLPLGIQDHLLAHYMASLSLLRTVNHDAFLDGYKYCALNRNLQILGAFAFLSRHKGKKDFEAYIPPALSSLKARVGALGREECPKLRTLIDSI